MVKLGQGQLLVVVFIQIVEDGPENVVVFDVFEQIGELFLRYILVSVLGYGFDFGLGSVEGPFDDWSEREEVG